MLNGIVKSLIITHLPYCMLDHIRESVDWPNFNLDFARSSPELRWADNRRTELLNLLGEYFFIDKLFDIN